MQDFSLYLVEVTAYFKLLTLNLHQTSATT